MLWGRPKVKIDFSELNHSDHKSLICEITNAPINNAILRRLGVRREPATISAEFNISDAGTNHVLVDTARAWLFDPLDHNRSKGSLRASIIDHMPLFFTCLVHASDDRAVVMSDSLSGQTAIVFPAGRYVVGVRLSCGHIHF